MKYICLKTFTLEQIQDEHAFTEATYVSKVVGKGLSSLSFEQEDKTKLDTIEDVIINEIAEERVYTEGAYVHVTAGKQLSTLSFEPADKAKIDGIEQYVYDELCDERDYNEGLYVKQIPGKGLSTLSFETVDKEKLDGLQAYIDAKDVVINDRIDDEVIALEGKITTEKTYSASTYVAKVSGKQLSTLSFEQADKAKITGIDGQITAATNAEITRADGKYVAKVAGKQLSTLSFEQADKDKIYVLVNTDNLTEGSVNKYFTAPRAVNSALTGYVVGGNVAVVPEDTVMQAIAKLQAQINVLKGTVVDLQNQINTNHPPANP